MTRTGLYTPLANVLISGCDALNPDADVLVSGIDWGDRGKNSYSPAQLRAKAKQVK